jgi:hypothetical protein
MLTTSEQSWSVRAYYCISPFSECVQQHHRSCQTYAWRLRYRILFSMGWSQLSPVGVSFSAQIETPSLIDRLKVWENPGVLMRGGNERHGRL